MHHELLGEIKDVGGELSAIVVYQGRSIKISIYLDGETVEKVIAVTARIVGQLTALDELAKQIIVRDLRENYNDNWRAYDELMPDKSLKKTTNPELSEAEFESRFSLKSIHMTGCDGVEFDYGKSDLFWGHTVSVESFVGEDFSKAIAKCEG